jgi:hypothetical protein
MLNMDWMYVMHSEHDEIDHHRKCSGGGDHAHVQDGEG